MLSLFDWSAWRSARRIGSRSLIRGEYLWNDFEGLESRVLLAIFAPSNGSELATDVFLANMNTDVGNTIVLQAKSYQVSNLLIQNLKASDTLSETLTIVGAGRGQSILDGVGIDRVLQVLDTDPLSPGLTVVLKHLSIEHGRVEMTQDKLDTNPDDGVGGGLFVDGGQVTLSDVAVQYNTAAGAPGGRGMDGGVSGKHDAESGTNGMDASGGGIFLKSGSLNIVNSLIANNTAHGGDGGDGGNGLDATAGDTSLTLYFPRRGGYGGEGGGGGTAQGGAIVSSGSLTISSSQIVDNKALGGRAGNGGNGGAGGDGVAQNIYQSDGGHSFGAPGGFGGYAFGGGLYFFDVSAGGKAILKNSTLTGNRAIGGQGGNGGVGTRGGNGAAGVDSPNPPDTGAADGFDGGLGGDVFNGAGDFGGEAHGGAIYIHKSADSQGVSIIACEITNNSAQGGAGGSALGGGQDGGGGAGGNGYFIAADSAYHDRGGKGGDDGTYDHYHIGLGSAYYAGNGGSGGRGGLAYGGGIDIKAGIVTLGADTLSGNSAEGGAGGNGGQGPVGGNGGNGGAGYGAAGAGGTGGDSHGGWGGWGGDGGGAFGGSINSSVTPRSRSKLYIDATTTYSGTCIGGSPGSGGAGGSAGIAGMGGAGATAGNTGTIQPGFAGVPGSAGGISGSDFAGLPPTNAATFPATKLYVSEIAGVFQQSSGFSFVPVGGSVPFQVTVYAETANGTLDPTFNGFVTAQVFPYDDPILGLPETWVLSGTLTVQVVNGIATFTDLQVNQAGKCTLVLLADSGIGTGTGLAVGFSPAQIRKAYGLDALSLDGAGQTIAIIGAFDNSNLLNSTDVNFQYSDLARFDALMGIPDSDPPAFSFTRLDQSGGATDKKWAKEAALDVEWAHAIAPRANIVLVESSATDQDDLATFFAKMTNAVNTACNQPEVSVVSMSWGSNERFPYLSQTLEAQFDAVCSRRGITFISATGDHGESSYPASSPNVVAVGGTSLAINADGTYDAEVAWNNGLDSALLGGTGGGISPLEIEPHYQLTVQATGFRTTPDVALVADGRTPVLIYDACNNGADTNWCNSGGGTSLATPCWAGLLALVDQQRVLDGRQTLSSGTALIGLYNLPHADFVDITYGFNYFYSAHVGYDFLTGLGTPRANVLVPDLANTVVATQLAMTVTPPSNVLAGDDFTVTVAAENADGDIDTHFNYDVTLMLGDNPGNSVLDGTVTINAVNGIATLNNLSLNHFGVGYTLQASTTFLSYGTGNALTPATTPAFNVIDQLVVTSQPPSTVGVNSPFAVQVSGLDSLGQIDTAFDADVTIALASNPGASTLGGPLTVSASNGVASFTGLVLNNTGSGYTLVASAPNFLPVDTSPFDVASPLSFGNGGSTLTVHGTGTNDTITLLGGTTYIATINGFAYPFPPVGITQIFIVAGDGDDTITVDGVSIPTSVDGEAGNNAIVGANVSIIWNITGVNGGNLNGISFSNVQNLAGGSFSDSFMFAAGGTLSGVIDGGAGTNSLFGPDTINIWNISGANAGNVNGSTFTNIQNLTGGAFADTFKFNSGATLSGTVNGGGGTNTLDYSLYTTQVRMNLATGQATAIKSTQSGGISNIGSVIGGSASDLLTASNTNNTWNITGNNSGNVVRDVGNTITFSSIENLNGGSGNDSYNFSDAKLVSGVVSGGAGVNTLDYSPYTTPIVVHFANGAATGIFVTKSSGFVNIQNVIGGSAIDRVSGYNATNTWNVTANNTGNFAWTNGGSSGTVNFSSIETLTGGTLDDTFRFGNGTLVDGLVIGGASGMDTLDYTGYMSPVSVNLGNTAAAGINHTAASGFYGIDKAVGGSASDLLTGPNTTNPWNITGANSGTVGAFNYSGFERLGGGSQSDTFTFANAGSQSGLVSGGPGVNTLDYSLRTTGVTVNLVPATGVATATGGVLLMDNVVGTSQNDTITARAAGNMITANGGTDALSGNAGNDTIILGATQAAGTTLNGLGGTDTLISPNLGNAWNVTGTNSGNVNGLAFANIENLTGGTFVDTFTFGTSGSLGGTVAGGGGTSDMLSGPDLSRSWNITGTNAGSLMNGGTTLAVFNKIPNLAGGAQGDKFNFGPAGFVNGSINGGGGSDTLDYTSRMLSVAVNLQTSTATAIGGGYLSIEGIVGGLGTNTLFGLNAGSLYGITSTNTGNVNGGFSFSGIQNLTGGSGTDTFQFSDGAGVTGIVSGGTVVNDDWLDYSAYTTPITVNLSTNTADHTGGINRIRNVRGGNGGNNLTGGSSSILVGGSGVDTLTGLSGRNILIGRGGADSITGGTGDDLLIGGTTDYDADTAVAALLSIAAEWRSVNTYAVRVDHLRNATGLNGANKLILGTGAGTTVHHDAAIDDLIGGGALDWFFANQGPGGVLDQLVDLNNGGTEQVN